MPQVTMHLAYNSQPEELFQRQKDFASKLSLMKYEAGRLGLYRTMQAIEVPLKEIGWEIAGEWPRKAREAKP